VKRSSTSGAIVILDTAAGSTVGSITPLGPTTIFDVALMPGDATILFARQHVSGDYVIESASAADGDRNHEAVTTAISDLPARPTSIAIARSGADTYLGVVTSPDFLIYKLSGTTWTLQSTINIGSTSTVRDVAALDTGTGVAFYILRPSFTQAPNVVAYNVDGSARPVTFAAVPSSFQGYTWESITAAPSVDGEPSLYVAGEMWDETITPNLSVFRYTATGAYTGEGFGFGLSASEPLASLEALNTDPLPIPGAISGNSFYIAGALSGRYSGGAQYVKVTINQSAAQPGRVLGTVSQTEPGPEPAAGARLVVEGRSTPTASAGADGSYTLGPLNPGTYTVGAWKYGFVAASQSVAVASGEDHTGVNFTLPGAVPAFEVAPAFVPPVMDGWTFAGEYPTPEMPFTLLGGAEPDPGLETSAWVTHDEEQLYVLVVGREPSLALNSSQSTNAQMLTLDDNVQIYVDPPHRHNTQAENSQLYQFVVNIPAAIDGVPYGTSFQFQRRIDADGNLAGSFSSTSWDTRVGYTADGWIVEARIPFTTLGLTSPPEPNAEWGFLVGRHRPTTHNDNLPPLYSTSPKQQTQLTWPNTWSDIRISAISTSVTGDVNRNGVLDPADAVFVLRMAGGLSFARPGFLDQNTAYYNALLDVADVWPGPAGDNQITQLDAVRLMRAAAGQETLP